MDLEEIDLVERFEHVGDDWPIYAVIVPTEGAATCDSSDDPGGPAPASTLDSEDEEEEEEDKPKKKKKKKN